MMSTPKLLLWIALVGLSIYVFFFGFNRLQQNVNSQFGGVEDNFQSNLEYFGRKTHLDELINYAKSELNGVTGSKSKQEANSTTVGEARHKRHRVRQSDTPEDTTNDSR
jgi:hypothetical protein